MTIAAQEIPHIAKGESVVADLDTLAFPKAYSQLAPGRYYVQAAGLPRNVKVEIDVIAAF